MNQEMCVHLWQTRIVALRFAQSKPKKVAPLEFSCGADSFVNEQTSAASKSPLRTIAAAGISHDSERVSDKTHSPS
ncbi:hypothetical protein [Cohnella sp.]|uniref:hypothetical protein n=1 Tax=Cohnella sp. TaxID=1883426 RepID=UPI00356200FA